MVLETKVIKISKSKTCVLLLLLLNEQFAGNSTAIDVPCFEFPDYLQGFLKIIYNLPTTVALGALYIKECFNLEMPAMVSTIPINHPSENKPVIRKISLCLELCSQILMEMIGLAICSEGQQSAPCQRAGGSKFRRQGPQTTASLVSKPQRCRSCDS